MLEEEELAAWKVFKLVQPRVSIREYCFYVGLKVTKAILERLSMTFTTNGKRPK